MKNLKYLANQISEKLNYWEETAREYEKDGCSSNWERAHVDAYESVLELIEELIED